MFFESCFIVRHSFCGFVLWSNESRCFCQLFRVFSFILFVISMLRLVMFGFVGSCLRRLSLFVMSAMISGVSLGLNCLTKPCGICSFEALLMALRMMVSAWCGLRCGSGMGEMRVSTACLKASQFAFLKLV